MSMKKLRKATMAAMVLFGCVCAPVVATVSYGQLVDEKGNKVESDTSKQFASDYTIYGIIDSVDLRGKRTYDKAEEENPCSWQK